MKTILPLNSNLSRANTVTVDAEKLAQLNMLNDTELRQVLGDATAKFVKTYLEHILKDKPDFTVGQALQVISMMADDIRKFTGVALETVDEYHPDLFPPEDVAGEDENEGGGEGEEEGEGEAGANGSSSSSSNEMDGVSGQAAQPHDDINRGARLFNSFGRSRIRPRG